MDLAAYPTTPAWDELVEHGRARASLGGFARFLDGVDLADLRVRQDAAEAAIRAMGVSFTVYADGGNIDRSWPFDVLPRVITAEAWAPVAAGLAQRLRALNHFLADVYGPQKILADGVVPPELVLSSPNYRPECLGMDLSHGVWAHICGTDLVRGADGAFFVLEDNLRVPSGVAYMLENRLITKRVFPELFRDLEILPVDDYPQRLHGLLSSLSPRPGHQPVIVVLTPGIHNAAYFEHATLAQLMGVELAEGSDLVVDADDIVHLRTVGGLRRVDVIYRRIDDLFLDPEVFHPDSTLGVPGLMRAWRAGNVAIANAPGAGVADDKVVYSYVPDMVRYYLGEEPAVDNVPTYRGDTDLRWILGHIDELVVKPANESGGYGVVVGPHASAAELEACRARLRADPRGHVAQPVIPISTAPTLTPGDPVAVAPRHVDLRPFVLSGADISVTTGGLTRVALREGSLIVNSSQGGGSKDTWILDPTV